MEEQKDSKLRQIWNDKRGRALLKLIGWFFFLLVVAILFATMGTNETEEQRKIDSNKTINKEWKDIDVMLNEFETKDYRYDYKIMKLETKEFITYQGEKQGEIETGYRESKIGIIKYKIQEDITYQVLTDQEEPMDYLYEEEDIPYITISNIKEMIFMMPKDEIKNDKLRTITYQDENKKIVIESNEENVTSIQIVIEKKEYTLNYRF